MATTTSNSMSVNARRMLEAIGFTISGLKFQEIQLLPQETPRIRNLYNGARTTFRDSELIVRESISWRAWEAIHSANIGGTSSASPTHKLRGMNSALQINAAYSDREPDI
jgi:hypothetical protein